MRLAIVLSEQQSPRPKPLDAVTPYAGWYEGTLVAELQRRGHEVVVFAKGKPSKSRCEEEVPPRGGVVEFVGGRGGSALGLWQFARATQRRIKRGGFDASLSLSTSVPATVLVLREGTERERRRRAAEAAPPELKSIAKALFSRVRPRTLARLRLERRTLRTASVRCIVATNTYVRRQLLEAATDPQRVVMVPGPGLTNTDVDAQQRQNWRRELRQRLGISSQETLYLFDSYRPQLDGLDCLLAAFKKVTDEGLSAVLLLTGLTQWRHEQKLIRLGLRQRVRFLGQTRCTQAVYAAADVSVQPTYFDPAGEVAMQSLAMDVPAITTAYSGAAELLLGPSGERLGRVVAEPGDVAGLAEAMRELAARPRDPFSPLSPADHRNGQDWPQAVSVAEHVERLLEVLGEAKDGCTKA